MRVYYSKYQILNPITGNVIKNNTSNRRSVVKQIKNYRQRYPYEGKTLLTKTKADKVLTKKDLQLDGDVRINRFGTWGQGGIGYLGTSAMAEVSKIGKGRVKNSEKTFVEDSLEKVTGDSWEADAIGTTRFFWRPESQIPELVVVACSNKKIWDEEDPIVRMNKGQEGGFQSVIGPGKPTPSQDIKNAYSSPLFKKSIDWAVNRDLPVNVVSAKYGLLAEGTNIHDYDKTISDMSKKQKENWAEAVSKSIIERAPTLYTHPFYGYGEGASMDVKPKRVYLLAGKAYTDLIAPKLRQAGIEVVEPLEGMQIGERLSYLKKDNDAFKELGVQRNTPLTWRSGMSDLKWRKGDRYEEYPGYGWGYSELYPDRSPMPKTELMQMHTDYRKKREAAIKKELGQ
jgi:hypothetical protein